MLLIPYAAVKTKYRAQFLAVGKLNPKEKGQKSLSLK
jgi:hypothetical protein